MPEIWKIEAELSARAELERKLHLKELQLKGLLAITQAINDNVSADGLFNMYSRFLQFEMAVPKMALLFQEDDSWEVKAYCGEKPDFSSIKLDDELKRIVRTSRLDLDSLQVFSQFDIVIPVSHKHSAIAYTFIGGFDDRDDIMDKVAFITTITNVIAVAIENKRLFKRQLQQEVLSKELSLASEIQRTLVPSKLPQGEHYQLASIYKPHFAVGGDYYDVAEFHDGTLAFCIADVAGKGMSAALLMANFQASLHALLYRGLPLEEIVREINASVFRVTSGDRFVTLFLARYSPKDRTLHFINAGHPPPILLADDAVIRLETGCTPIGWMPTLDRIDIGGICLTSPNSLLFSYTDGINDIINEKGQYFEDQLLSDFLIKNRPFGPKSLNTNLLHHLEHFKGSMAFPDDITVLTAQFA